MDVKASAVRSLKNASKVFLQDLEALPHDAFSRSLGGTARTVADIAFEVNLVNDHIGMALRGETPFEWPEEGWIKAPEEFRDKSTVIEAFKRSSERILATAEALSPEQFEEAIQTDQGESTRYQRCQFMTLHLWYHSGQLNFIQTLLGDFDWHWS